MVNPLYTLAEKKSVNIEAREVTAWASRSDVIDRDNEIISAKAWMDPESTKDYELNPIILAFHKYDQLPLGKCVDLKKTDKGLWFTAKFANTSAASEAFQFIRDTGIAAFSCGFFPVRYRDLSLKEVEKMGYDISNVTSDKVRIWDSVRLLEISLCTIPSCQTALSAAFEAGQIKQKDLLHALTEWKKASTLQEMAKKIVSSLPFQNLIREKVAQALKEKIKAKEVADFTARETLKQTQIEMLKLKGVVVPEGEEDAYIDRFWPKKKTEAEVLRVSAIREIAERLANFMKK